MWGLEYGLLFGVPSNKTETWDSRSRWTFTFPSRQESEEHFAHWIDTFCRWKQIEKPARIRIGSRRRQARLDDILIELYPRPIRMVLPMNFEVFEAFIDNFWLPTAWPGVDQGRKWSQWVAGLDHQDVNMNFWCMFQSLAMRHGGVHGSRTCIALSSTAVVEPDQYYFQQPRHECTIDDDYFKGVPELIVEVLSPASRWIDRGPRKEVYRRAGLQRLWLVDTERETIETYRLRKGIFDLEGTYGYGDLFACDLFPGESIDAARFFQTQSKRRPWPGQQPECPATSRRPLPAWVTLGLEHFFLLGHPEHRWEIWGNKAPSVLSFATEEEAAARLPSFIEEASRWECQPAPTPIEISPGVRVAEVGRFHFRQDGRLIHLDVKVDARKYHALLNFWGKSDAWDWGVRQSM